MFLEGFRWYWKCWGSSARSRWGCRVLPPCGFRCLFIALPGPHYSPRGNRVHRAAHPEPLAMSVHWLLRKPRTSQSTLSLLLPLFSSSHQLCCITSSHHASHFGVKLCKAVLNKPFSGQDSPAPTPVSLADWNAKRDQSGVTITSTAHGCNCFCVKTAHARVDFGT